MSWRSLLTIQQGSAGDAAIRAAAIDFARRTDAHLDIIALGIDRAQTGFHYVDMSTAALQQSLQEALESAETLENALEKELMNEGIRSNVIRLVSPMGSVATEVARYTRFADLAMMPLPYGEGASGDEAFLVEAALFEANIPALLLPRGSDVFTPPSRVLLGWNESPEALAAARAALPLLQQADTVYVCVIDPPRHGPNRSDPGGLISQYLARHGVRCEVDVKAKTLPRISDVLLRTVSDRDIDMVVMGAYGRARWSEAMFGGATRDMLEHANVPVLMTR